MKLFFLFILFNLMAFASWGQTDHIITVSNKGWGVKSTNNKVIVPFDFTKILPPQFQIYPVQNSEGKWGFYTNEGQLISDCKFDNFNIISNKYIICQFAYKWGVINHQGKIIVDFKYKFISTKSNKELNLYEYNQWLLKTTDNKTIKTFEYDSLVYVGNKMYRFCLAGNFGIANEDGTIITLHQIALYSNSIKEENTKGILTCNEDSSICTLKIPQSSRFDKIYQFNDGFARFKADGKFGFIDSLGNIRLANRYPKARHFSEGMVAIMLRGKWGFMDKNEKLKIQPYYDEVSDFNQGICIARIEDKFYFLNKDGKAIQNDPLDKITPLLSGNYIIQKNNKYGLTNPNGIEIATLKYEDIIEVKGRFIIAKEHGLYGLLAPNGNIIIPFNHPTIQYIPESGLFLCQKEGIHKTHILK